MPPGQTPHTVVLYAHHDLVDSVQPGDRYVVMVTMLSWLSCCHGYILFFIN